MDDDTLGAAAVVSREAVLAARDAASAGRRQQKSYYVTAEVFERVNAAVMWARPSALFQALQTGEEVDLDDLPDSASALVEFAMWAEVLRLEHSYNGGNPFPATTGKLKTGPGRRGVVRMSQPRLRDDPDTSGDGPDPHVE